MAGRSPCEGIFNNVLLAGSAVELVRSGFTGLAGMIDAAGGAEEISFPSCEKRGEEKKKRGMKAIKKKFLADCFAV